MSFRGTLRDHYLGSAEKCGVSISEDVPFEEYFSIAYQEGSAKFPCFGSEEISAKDWWKWVVLRSFQLAGTTMTETQEERVFSTDLQRLWKPQGLRDFS